jgi:hypothetical protein
MPGLGDGRPDVPVRDHAGVSRQIANVGLGVAGFLHGSLRHLTRMRSSCVRDHRTAVSDGSTAGAVARNEHRGLDIAFHLRQPEDHEVAFDWA